MKKLLLLLFLILPTTANAQNVWDWNKKGGGFTSKPLYKNEVQVQATLPGYKWKFVEDERRATQHVYNRNPIVRPDGSFSSARFIDINPKAKELYSVSGAAINAYSRESFANRQRVENQIQVDRAAWEARRYYWLHNTTPWLP